MCFGLLISIVLLCIFYLKRYRLTLLKENFSHSHLPMLLCKEETIVDANGAARKLFPKLKENRTSVLLKRVIGIDTKEIFDKKTQPVRHKCQEKECLLFAERRKGGYTLVHIVDITLLSKQQESIRNQAQLDTLTKLPNRAKFNKALNEAIYRSQKNGQLFALTLFDIDKFKKINDTYGHDAGDAVLTELARLVHGLLRRNDMVARWGGEEFAILSPFTNEKEAYLLADRLRRQIASYPFSIVKHLSCSFGVTAYRAGDTADTIFKRADEALYESKQGGRNRVTLYA